MEQLNISRHRHHYRDRSRLDRVSPASISSKNFNQYSNYDNYNRVSTQVSVPIHCSAYFLGRIDLQNYAAFTLKQTVDNFVSGPKSKGLKVKLSLLHEGLIIENITDPNQSWMYKLSELLYFWRDSYYSNIIVVVTLNQPHYYSNGPYSASIFRLRGNETVPLFIEQAQNYFSKLSTSDNSRKTFKSSFETNSNKTKSNRSTEAMPVHFVSRAEFDPGKKTTDNSTLSSYYRRTYSETTLSTDSSNYDNKTNNAKNQLSMEHVMELLRELRQLRNEIATLKLDEKLVQVRSESTSPILELSENAEQRLNSSPTQTDFSSINQTQQQVSNDSIQIVSHNQDKFSESPSINSNEINGSSKTTSIALTTNDVHSNDTSAGEIVSFRSSFDVAPEQIYENFPVVIKKTSNIGFYVNLSDINQEQQVSSVEFDPQELTQTKRRKVNNQPVIFANHLTNPLFNVDKQLLSNTVANRFGVDHNSPYLPELVANQHLFTTQKRTFANMIWQITPEEENALCSSPITTTNINTIHSNNSMSKSILKSNNNNNSLRTLSKRQRISWDTALE